MEHGPELHGVNHELDAVGELEPDDLHQVARRVGADRKNPGRVSIRIEIHHDQRLLDSMHDSGFVVAVLERRTVELHTRPS